MKVSLDGEIMAVMLGRFLPKQEYQIESINFYDICESDSPPSYDWKYKLKYTRDISAEGNDISTCFEFCIHQQNCIFLFDTCQIYQYDYAEDTWQVFSQFNCELEKKPEIFVFNESQTLAFVAVKEDIFFTKFKTEEEIDIDTMYRISDVKACIFHGNKFLILCSKCEKVRGVYLLCIDEDKIDDYNKKNMIIKWKTHLRIGDGAIHMA